jgi:peptidyl-prolyl cis-trans isomerase A (cyclophilin A)
MLRRFAPAALLWLCATPAVAQAPAPPAPAPVQTPAATPRPATVRVTLQTSAGPIVLELEKERAPTTTANFLRYVDQRRLDGTSFYRATKVAEGYGLIQGGVRNDPKRVLPPIAHEPTTRTGLSHVDGAISMARAEPGSATADFFITVGAMPSMDADPKQPGDNLGFAAFGRVVEGMDVVRRILDAPTSPTEGEGAMKGQMIAAPITIIAARRSE